MRILKINLAFVVIFGFIIGMYLAYISFYSLIRREYILFINDSYFVTVIIALVSIILLTQSTVAAAAIFVRPRGLLCKILDHDMGEWVYIVSNACWQTRACRRDGYQVKRIAHEFGKWEYETSNACCQVRTCRRDGYQEKREAHEFGEWEYETSDSCWQVRTCIRDGAQERREVHYEFGRWVAQDGEPYPVYEHGAQGDEKWTWDERKCLRCGHSETKNYKKWWR